MVHGFRLSAQATTGHWGGWVSSEWVTTLEERVSRQPLRVLAIEGIGPLTVLAGIVWAIAQPYRITFLYRDGKGFYDFLVQPPLLVVGVGLFFAFAIAPGILDDLREGNGAAR